jgi:hypothetical protein
VNYLEGGRKGRKGEKGRKGPKEIQNSKFKIIKGI